MNPIERLENWKFGHKARSCQIGIDDGYGATCWRIKLFHEKICFEGTEYRNVEAWECSFWELPEGKEWPVNLVYVSGPDDEECFPGLAAVINAAINRFDLLKQKDKA